MGIVGSSTGIRSILLPCALKASLFDRIKDNYPENRAAEPEFFDDLSVRLQRYIDGEQVNFPDTLDMSHATKFQQNVWNIARLIPYGETRSYGWIASQLDSGRSARAVGQALARNPLPIIIPCHRVIANDGALTGFADGLAMKEYLLHIEEA
jgi:methylated-DNA-[protein]-cysteine S-methyltransferase